MRVGVQPQGRLGQVQVGVAPTGEVDLATLGRALWRKRIPIAGLTLLAAVLAGIAVNLITVAEPPVILRPAADAEWARAVERLRRSVAEAEARLAQHRSNAELSVGKIAVSSNQQLGNFQAMLAAAQAQKVSSEARARLIRDALKAGTPIEFSDLVDSEPMRRLSEQRGVLRMQLAEQPATSQQPRARELRAQVADLDAQMHEEADRLARSLESEARFASIKINALTSALERLARPAGFTDGQDVQLRALERDAKSQRDLLKSTLAENAQANARASSGAAPPEVRFIASGAVANAPSSPGKLPTVLVAALATFMLASGFVLRGELRRIPPAQDAAALASAAVAMRRSRGLAAATRAIEHARSRAGVRLEAIEGLAHELGTVGEGARRIAVIGAARNVGTTMTVIALARSLSRQARVVLVDLALGPPGLSIIASDPTAAGVAELARGSASFGEIITRDRHSRLHLVMAGREPVDAVVMGSQRLLTAIEALGRSYDYVIVDAGAAADAWLDRLAMLAPHAVLVGPQLDPRQTAEARVELRKAGFAEVSVLAGIPRSPEDAVIMQAAA